MGENIADLGGRRAPIIDGYTGDQRVFLGLAQIWREAPRPDQERQQLVTDGHSPGRYRLMTAERNMDAWYRAFDVGPGDKLYLPPEDRVTIW